MELEKLPIYRKDRGMTIVVTTNGKDGEHYTVDVMDGELLIWTELVDGTAKRDDLVWRLAELYNAVDIIMAKGSEPDQKFSEIPSIPVLSEADAGAFFDLECGFVCKRILQAVGEGFRFKRSVIRLFELNGTGVYITSNKQDWKTGVQQALDYFITTEEYDKCIEARQLLLKL